MSDDKADDIEADLLRWTEPPLTPEERRRRVVRLCCSFMRNLAFHRAGMQGEVQFNLFARTALSHQLGAARVQGLEDPLNFRARWRLATSGTLRLLGREACGGK
jgi:hypothetical protein